MLVVLARATDYATDQRAWLVVKGNECVHLDTSKVEFWIPMVDGRPDDKHGEIRHIWATYDANCGVYRVEKVESSK